MTVLNLAAQTPFVTKDGSEIRSILDRTNAPVEKQSLAEGCDFDRGGSVAHDLGGGAAAVFVLLRAALRS